MVNTTHVADARPGGPDLGGASRIVGAYVAVTVATLVALVVLSSTDPHEATGDAWGHAVLVAAFAILLPVRLRAARRGSRRAVVAVGVIACALLAVNVVEAALPGAFPGWMRIEMVAIAALMAALAGRVLAGRSR